jgi:hypothetical protein
VRLQGSKHGWWCEAPKKIVQQVHKMFRVVRLCHGMFFVSYNNSQASICQKRLQIMCVVRINVNLECVWINVYFVKRRKEWLRTKNKEKNWWRHEKSYGEHMFCSRPKRTKNWNHHTDINVICKKAGHERKRMENHKMFSTITRELI